MKRHQQVLITTLILGAFNASAQQLYWAENGETSTSGQLANIPLSDATNLSTNFDDWFVFTGNIVNQNVTTNRVTPATLTVNGYPDSGTGNVLYTSTLNAAGQFKQNNIEYNRRIGNPTGSQTLYLSAVLSVFQVRTDDPRFPFGFAEIVNNDGDPSSITRTWGSRILIDKLSGDTSNGTYQVGVTKNGTDRAYPDLVADPTKEFSTGDVIVVVMRLTTDGIDNANDQLDLFVSTSIPAAEPMTWDASITTGVDAAVNGIFIREKMDGAKSVQDPFVDFGYLRIADTWSELLPSTAVTSIGITSENNATEVEEFSTLQMSASVLPVDATFNTVTWSVTNGTGVAEITEDGNLIGYKAGTVTVVASADDASGVTAQQMITITENAENGLIYRAEAELGELLSGAVLASTTCENRSGDGVVKYSDSGTANSTHGNIFIPSDGDYLLKLTYWSGNASPSTLDFSTNGVDYTPISFDPAGDCSGGPASVKEILLDDIAAGEYTFYFKNTNLSNPEPLLDILEVTESVRITSIALTSDGGTDAVAVDGMLQITEEILPAGASDNSVTWSVEGSSFGASIDGNGLLTAGNSDEFITVKATANDGSGITGSLEITVGSPPILVETISVSSAEGTEISEGETSQMSATVSPLDATDQTVTWSVTNGTGAASITTGGLLTANTEGLVTVVATANDGSGITGELNIVIGTPIILVSEINVTSDDGTDVVVGNTAQMSAEVLPAETTDPSFTWSVTNGSGEATIDANGLLTAVAQGTVTVVATADDASGTTGSLEINVITILVNDINLSSSEGPTIDVSATTQLNAEVLPADATDPSITWSVTNGTGEATIDQNGLLSAVAVGTVTATATADDASGITGSIIIEIVVFAQTVTVSGSGDATTFEEFNTLQMEATVLPAGADQTVDWSVTNGTGVATISETGLLSAWQTGTVVVKAITEDGTDIFGEQEITITETQEEGLIYRVQAEAGNLSSGAAVTATGCTNKSGEGIVKYSDDLTANSSHENIVIDASGQYILRLTYFSAITSILEFSTDGTNYTQQDFTDGIGFCTDGPSVTQDITITLSEGINTIYFRNSGLDDTAEPLLDIVEVYEVPPVLVETINITTQGDVSQIDIGNTLQMSAEVLPADAEDLSFVWSVEGTAASIDQNGLLTGNSEGVVTVTATANDGSGVTGSIMITIGSPVILVSEITVTSAAGASIDVGQTSQMSAAVLPANATDISVVWSVTNGTGEGTIDQNGLFTTVSAGTVTINATANDASNVTGSFELAITDPIVLVTEIAVTSAAGSSIDVGQTSQMSAAVSPINATDISVTWSVTNGTGEGTIDQNGLFTAGSAGTVTIVATANDASNVTGSFEITLTDPVVLVSEINVSSASGVSIDIGETSQMSAEVLPATATDASVTWSVVNETGEATIDENGLLTAVAAGMVRAVATANDASAVTGELQIEITAVVLGLEDLKVDVVVYPNPVVNAFRLEVGKIKISTIEMIDMQGNKIFETIHNNQIINISRLPSANYLIRAVSTDGESYITRIIKE